MKRFLAVLLAVLLLIPSLASCTESRYEPVESTEQERRVLATLEIGGNKYELKYELYRALFFALHEEIDGGDTSVFAGEQAEEYNAKIDALIIDRAATIYSVFALCKSIGIDLYSSAVDEIVNEYITVSVEGGSIGDYAIEGTESYEKYLSDLAEAGFNYSVQDLIYRYTIGLDMISEYYKGSPDGTKFGAIEYSRDDVKAFYDSDDSARIIRAFFDAAYISGRERAEQIRNEAATLSGEAEIASFITGYTTLGGSDIRNGIVIGKYSLDQMNYGELTDAAFSLEVGEVSELMTIYSTSESGYCFIYKAEKSDRHFSECYDGIVSAYLENEIGKQLNLRYVGLKSSATATGELSALDRTAIIAN